MCADKTSYYIFLIHSRYIWKLDIFYFSKFLQEEEMNHLLLFIHICQIVLDIFGVSLPFRRLPNLSLRKLGRVSAGKCKVARRPKFKVQKGRLSVCPTVGATRREITTVSSSGPNCRQLLPIARRPCRCCSCNLRLAQTSSAARGRCIRNAIAPTGAIITMIILAMYSGRPVDATPSWPLLRSSWFPFSSVLLTRIIRRPRVNCELR